MPESVYIHIPFCKSKCKYCSFVSVTNLEYIDDYVGALIAEITHYYQSESLKTIYLGGGTPSLLKPSIIEKILKHLCISSNTEITCEINPDDVNKTYLRNLKELGINRLSFGSQTFNDEILNSIGRRHTSANIIKSIEYAHNAEFQNISIDLMYGLPNQTMALLKEDLKIIKTLDIKHISTYGLKIDEPSFYYYNKPQNLPNDDEQADMYIEINNFLESNKYKRYEISNFSVDGYESRHNLNYWNNLEYYGFGTAAHGYVNNIRYSNTDSLEEYIKNPISCKSKHKVTKSECLEEEIFLGFRKAAGINIKSINNKFNIDFKSKYENILSKYIPDYIIKTAEGYKFTIKGVLLSTNILADFLD